MAAEPLTIVPSDAENGHTVALAVAVARPGPSLPPASVRCPAHLQSFKSVNLVVRLARLICPRHAWCSLSAHLPIACAPSATEPHAASAA